MSRLNGAGDEHFDYAGFEVPFAGNLEEPSSDVETGFGGEADTPFAESSFENEGLEAEADKRTPAPIPGSGQTRGPSGQLTVSKHPLLRSHRGTQPDVLLRWHNIRQPGAIDVVVHFHGYGHAGQKDTVTLREKERISGLDFSDPASPRTAGRTRPTLAILPRGHYAGGKYENAYTFPALTPKGAIQRLILDALSRVSRVTGHSVQMGRLILTGHSGGGAPLSAVLTHTDPDEVHVLDGLYGSSTALGNWAEKRIARDVASPASPPPAMRVVYRPGSSKSTQPNSEALARRLFPVLAAPAAARLKPYFRVEKTNVDHMTMPAKYGWRFLADAGGDVRGVTLYSGEPRATRESSFESALESLSTLEEGLNEAFEPEAGEDEQPESDETLTWLDVEALTDAVTEEEDQGAWESESVDTSEREADVEPEWEGYAEHEATDEYEDGDREDEDANEDADGLVGRFDAFEDERDAEWDLDEDEAMLEDEGPLAGSGLTAAEQKAVEITSLFETGKRGGFYGLSGNFDGQGLSFGLVNWTIGTGSLQPLLRDFAREQPQRWAQVFGPHALGFLAVITPTGAAATKVQHKFAVEQMNSSTVVGGQRKWTIKEPWVTYFTRLSADREFQQIQVRYVRDLLKRAAYFCQYFKLTSEMAFAYMFDAVSSHGKWWLTKTFNGQEKRRVLIEQKISALTKQHGEGRVPEAEILLAIADVLAATSAARWAANVRRRKRWFVNGEHPRAKELKGLEPRANVPFTTSGGSVVVAAPPAQPSRTPSSAPAPSPTVATDPGATIARIAEAELTRWHPASGDIRETDAAALPMLQKYWGAVGAPPSAANLQSKAWQAKHPWSAAFVSWVMKQAGARGFKSSGAHRVYISAAKHNRQNNVTSNPFWAYRTTEVAPQVGDLICNARAAHAATYDTIDNGETWATHCDIVTAVKPGSLRVIGGNVKQDVNTKTIRTLPDGKLAPDAKRQYFAVVRCRGKL